MTHISEGFPYPLLPKDASPLLSKGPLHKDGWERGLEFHPDKYYRETLIQIIEVGVRIGYQGPKVCILSKNLSSAEEDPDTLSKDLETQLQFDRITKIITPMEYFISSPLGLIPKSNGGFRRIHHLSHPKGQSVNCNIPKEFGTLEYTCFDEAVAMILKAGPGSMLMKKDLADAFRHVPVAECDWWLLGFEWKGSHYIERFLPFGLRTSPFIFDLFAKGLHWMLLNEGLKYILHYLDDFLGIIPPDEDAKPYTETFDSLCETLGLKVNKKKDKLHTIVDFLGIELDTNSMQARLPEEKLQKAIKLVNSALKKKSIPLEELQTLVGFLAFASKVIVPGRAFLRRLYNALYSEVGIIRLSSPIKEDLRWWKNFLPQWNGIYLMQQSKPIVKIWTDASGSYGIGGYILQEYESLNHISTTKAFSMRFSTRHRPMHINVKEMIAVLRALNHFGTSGCEVNLYCDNWAVVQGLRKSSIRGAAMEPLRKIAMLAALTNVTINAIWIPTKQNYLADMLSRGKLDAVANLYPFLQIITENHQHHGIRRSP